MLKSINDETVSEWQVGFRQIRGFRDNNTMVLHTIYDDVIEQVKEISMTFVDYTTAFDLVFHKFIDKTEF